MKKGFLRFWISFSLDQRNVLSELVLCFKSLQKNAKASIIFSFRIITFSIYYFNFLYSPSLSCLILIYLGSSIIKPMSFYNIIWEMVKFFNFLTFPSSISSLEWRTVYFFSLFLNPKVDFFYWILVTYLLIYFSILAFILSVTVFEKSFIFYFSWLLSILFFRRKDSNVFSFSNSSSPLYWSRISGVWTP